MIFRQLTHDDLGCASYLIGDEGVGVAAVVDPRLDIDEYLRLARYLCVRIEHVLETHNHADHVSGHGRLVAATGATIHIHRDAAPDYDWEPFDDGWELELGSLTVRAIHTPGHRPEHTAFALVDTARGPETWAVLSGDSLFVGDIARPDLAVDREEGARGIFRSLHEKLLPLPATCEVWPGHLGGSLCGGPGMDLKVSSTIGFERDHRPLLQLADEEERAPADARQRLRRPRRRGRRVPAHQRRLPRRPARRILTTTREEHMHNVDALEQTIVKARSHPEALKQHVEFGGEWQTGGGPQFVASIPVPNGEPVIFQADFPPPMGGTGSAPNPLAYCFWGGMACYAMT